MKQPAASIPAAAAEYATTVAIPWKTAAQDSTQLTTRPGESFIPLET